VKQQQAMEQENMRRANQPAQPGSAPQGTGEPPTSGEPDLKVIFETLPPEIQQIVSQMPPEQQVVFLSQPAEKIVADIDQFMGQGGGTNG
jgi:hypothetical protein